MKLTRNNGIYAFGSYEFTICAQKYKMFGFSGVQSETESFSELLNFMKTLQSFEGLKMHKLRLVFASTVLVKYF
jgi:hypothetical protein